MFLLVTHCTLLLEAYKFIFHLPRTKEVCEKSIWCMSNDEALALLYRCRRWCGKMMHFFHWMILMRTTCKYQLPSYFGQKSCWQNRQKLGGEVTFTQRATESERPIPGPEKGKKRPFSSPYWDCSTETQILVIRKKRRGRSFPTIG